MPRVRECLRSAAVCSITPSVVICSTVIRIQMVLGSTAPPVGSKLCMGGGTVGGSKQHGRFPLKCLLHETQQHVSGVVLSYCFQTVYRIQCL